MFLMVTGGSLMPSTREPAHGAERETRPVNSGKLFGLVEAFRRRFTPEAAIDEVVPLGNEIGPDGAAGDNAADQRAGVAEGDAECLQRARRWCWSFSPSRNGDEIRSNP